jgi:cAMP-dependent protein kinase regulator
MPGFLEEFLAGGRQEKDIRELQQKILQNRKNPHLLVKLGDLLERKGRRADALEAYGEAAARFSGEGFLIQAIAVNKIILRLDPAQTRIQEELAALYAERGIAAGETSGAAPALPFIPLFSDLKREEFLGLMPKIRNRRLAPGEFACRQGDPGNSLYMIGRGRVAVFREDGAKGRKDLNTLREGDFFGEFAFFSGSPRSATVEALEETEILEISKGDLDEIIREFPGVAQVLESFYRDRVADTLLATSVLFSSFSPSERKSLLQMFLPEEFPAGKMILEEGQPGDSLYLIKRGEVEVFTRDVQGEYLPLARLREGDFFGEIALITGRPRSASVKAREGVELLKLQRGGFNRVLKTHPEILAVLEESLRYRLGNKLKALGVFRESPRKERVL